MANAIVAYILWLFGGILGLHHLYLNRPRHFFIWFVTWGGMVLGWLSEASRIQEYVQETNKSAEYLRRIKELKKASPKPELSFVLIASSLMIGHQLSNVVVSAVPEDYILTTWYGTYLAHVLMALGSSMGVHLVANMGPQEAPFFLPFLASACTFPASYFLYNRRPIINLICVLVSAVVSCEYAQWSKTKKELDSFMSYVKVIGIALCGVALYGSLWTSNMYFNIKVSTLNGTMVPLRVVVSNFMQTQPLAEARDAVQDLLPCLRMYGYETCQYQIFSKLAEISDPERDRWAFSVLGFQKYPDQKQINSHCRKLAAKWHPDRFVTSDENHKKEAEKKFIDIQKACSMLNRLKQKRERKNTWTMSETDSMDTDSHQTKDYDDDYSEDGCDENTDYGDNTDRDGEYDGDDNELYNDDEEETRQKEDKVNEPSEEL